MWLLDVIAGVSFVAVKAPFVAVVDFPDGDGDAVALVACLFDGGVEVELQPGPGDVPGADEHGIRTAECHLFLNHVASVSDVLHFLFPP